MPSVGVEKPSTWGAYPDRSSLLGKTTIKNDEDVLVTQLGKAEVETNCSNKGLIHTSHVTPTHVPVNHVDGESPKYLITYTYTSHIITIHALVTYLKHVLQSVIFVFMKNLRSLPNFVC